MNLINGYEVIGGLRTEGHGDLTVMSEKLDSELARLLFRQAPFVSISLYFLLGIVVYFFWGSLSHPVLLVWAIVNFILATALIVLTLSYNLEPDGRDCAQWVRGYTFLTFLQDTSWGIIGPLSFLADSDVYQMLTLFMLGGMAAGSIATRGVVFKTYVVSIFSLLSPIIVAFAFNQNAASGGMLALTVVFLLFMLSVAKNYSRSIKNNILLWLDNEQLISELLVSKKEAENTNSVLVREIDNRLKVEEELVLAKEHAEQASAAKNQFLANVSHELRTPLNGVIGFNSMLQKSDIGEDNKRYVSQIDKSARTLLNMVNDILDITSIEAGHLKLFERPFSLRAEISDVIAVASTLASRKALELDCEVETGVPDNLIGDPDRMKQILNNLVGNAIKYTKDGFIRVRVKSDATRGEDGGVTIGFEVEDSGEGIPKSVQPILFENFTQGESFDHKRSEGVGLGLAIVKNLLDKMNGTITFDSVEGEGTVFRFYLPFRQGAKFSAPEAETRAKEAVSGYLGERSWKDLRVLLVDDNEINRMVLASFMQQFGVAYEEASSGVGALEKIETGDFDVALMDIQMPDLSGLEVASRVERMNGSRPSLVAVTAHAFPQQREEILNSGFVDCLIKPISESDLVRVFNQAGSQIQPKP